jgi:hypothetical protein
MSGSLANRLVEAATEAGTPEYAVEFDFDGLADSIEKGK